MKRASASTAASATSKRTRKPPTPSTTNAPLEPPSATQSADGIFRCWKTEAPASIDYHDGRWGNTVYFFPPSLSDSHSAEYRESLHRLFMMQSLELMQAGLSWSCIMGKWNGFVRAFDNFDVDTVSRYDDGDVERLMNDAGIVRNRLKINAIIHNARTIRSLQDSTPHGFLRLLFQHHLPGSPHRMHKHERILPSGRHQSSWMRTDYRTAGYKDRTETDGVHPSITVVELSKELKKVGFRFMGMSRHTHSHHPAVQRTHSHYCHSRRCSMNLLLCRRDGGVELDAGHRPYEPPRTRLRCVPAL